MLAAYDHDHWFLPTVKNEKKMQITSSWMLHEFSS